MHMIKSLSKIILHIFYCGFKWVRHESLLKYDFIETEDDDHDDFHMISLLRGLEKSLNKRKKIIKIKRNLSVVILEQNMINTIKSIGNR